MNQSKVSYDKNTFLSISYSDTSFMIVLQSKSFSFAFALFHFQEMLHLDQEVVAAAYCLALIPFHGMGFNLSYSTRKLKQSSFQNNTFFVLRNCEK